MRAVLGLVRACHPEACAVVTVVAVLLAVTAHRSVGGVVLVGTAVLFGQLSVGLLNDFLDADRDAGRDDKPVVSGDVSRRVVGVGAVVAGVVCVPLSLAVGVWPGVLHLVAVGSALGYDLGVKATVASVVPYLVSFGLLTVFAAWGHVSWWLPAAGALLGAGAHFANVLPDLAADEAAGVRGLPHRIGDVPSRVVTVVLLVATSAVLAVGPSGQLVARLVLSGVSLIVLVVGRRQLFRAVLVVALLDVVELVVAARG